MDRNDLKSLLIAPAQIRPDGTNDALYSGLRIVFITDPWGTEIELTEGLATTPIAGGSR